MTELTTVEANILNILAPYRIEEPVDFESIRKRSGHSRRSLQKHLENLKRKGHPIGSLKKEAWHGLYLARNLQELEPGMSADIKQAESTLESVRIRRNIDLEEYWKNIS
ncbi:TPA: hypothetical protein U2B74_002091 [Streptococcus suis]|nr:hypothetical protein [Streptococcus suis]HEM6071058.1 hypothetical protein [Streptococcus suis]